MKKQRKSIDSRSSEVRKRDEYTVVLEDIREQFKTLTEGARLEQAKFKEWDRKLDKMDRLSDDMEIVRTEVKALIERQDVLSDTMDRGFAKIHEQLEKLDRRITKLEVEVVKLAESVGIVAGKIDDIRVELVSVRQDLDRRISWPKWHELDRRVAKLERKIAAR